jgi:tRNA (cytidine/uridine-2'-O-)-methyltransferase
MTAATKGPCLPSASTDPLAKGLTQELIVVLVEPQIPGNTGNIMRLCACTGAKLYLVGRLGFVLNDKYLERSAMDYRDQVEPIHCATFEEVLARHEGYTPFFLSSKATQAHWGVVYPPKTMLVFGSETTGLPEAFLTAHAKHSVRIPMVPQARSLNLANAVSIVLYEALRQQNA